MKFYTNVSQYGNFILERGIQNGVPFKRKIEYAPHYSYPQKKIQNIKLFLVKMFPKLNLEILLMPKSLWISMIQ